MAASKSVSDSRGFTTDYFGRCCQCHREITPGHLVCDCTASICHVRPQPKQKEFIDMLLATGDDIPVRIGFGGSRGASKSRTFRDAALVVASEVAQTLPGIVIYIIRQIWGDVYQNHVKKLDLERPELTKFYSNKEYSFPDAMGGPRIVFGYGDTINDIRRVARGPEAYLMLIDQAEGFTEEELDELHTPNRWPASGPGGAKTAHSFNPGGKGSQYLKRVYFSRKFNTRERSCDFAFIQGYGWSNFDAWFANEGIVLDGQPLTFERFYKLPGELPDNASGIYDDDWLATIPEHHTFKLFVTKTSEGRKMWSKPDSIRMGDLFGRFDAFAGQAFAGVWDERKVVIR